MPEDVEFATKPALAQQMIFRVIEAGVSAAWVSGDEVDDSDSKPRAALENRGLGYVLAGLEQPCARRPDRPIRRAAELARSCPSYSLQVRSTGPGTKGPRLYSWAAITPVVDESPGQWWLLLRRNDSTGDLAYYRCYHHPRPAPLSEPVRAAGWRWKLAR